MYTLNTWRDYVCRYCADNSLSFDSNGVLSLLVDKHRVDCHLAMQHLILRARLCDLPTAPNRAEQHAWLKRVLQLSHTYADTRSEFPAISDARRLQLQTWITPRSDYAGFCHAFDQFIDALHAWRRCLLPTAANSYTSPPAPCIQPFQE